MSFQLSVVAHEPFFNTLNRVPGDTDEVNALKARCDQWIPPTNAPILIFWLHC